MPSQIGLLTKLQYFGVEEHLSGSLPTQLGLLQDLKVFDLSWNYDLNGTVPFDLQANLTRLESLDIGYQAFSGNLPTEIGLMTQLTSLRGYYAIPALVRHRTRKTDQVTRTDAGRL